MKIQRDIALLAGPKSLFVFNQTSVLINDVEDAFVTDITGDTPTTSNCVDCMEFADYIFGN